MGMSETTIYWTLHLERMGLFANLDSVLDFGPQDFLSPHWKVYRTVAEQVSSPISASDIKKLLALRQQTMRLGLLYWQMFGLKRYESLDPYQLDATHCYNLNYPISLNKEYSLIINGGTFEHIFNIAQCFINTDRLISSHGIVLHMLPSSGWINHGFYSFHPTLFHHIAKYNNYEILHEITFHGLEECNQYLAQNGYDANLFQEQHYVTPKDVKQANLDSLYCVAMRKKIKVQNAKFRFPEQEIWVPLKT